MIRKSMKRLCFMQRCCKPFRGGRKWNGGVQRRNWEGASLYSGASKEICTFSSESEDLKWDSCFAVDIHDAAAYVRFNAELAHDHRSSLACRITIIITLFMKKISDIREKFMGST